MAISDEQLSAWIECVAKLEGLMMDAEKLVEDIVLVAVAFNNDPETFSVVMANTIEAFPLILRASLLGVTRPDGFPILSKVIGPADTRPT